MRSDPDAAIIKQEFKRTKNQLRHSMIMTAHTYGELGSSTGNIDPSTLEETFYLRPRMVSSVRSNVIGRAIVGPVQENVCLGSNP